MKAIGTDAILDWEWNVTTPAEKTVPLNRAWGESVFRTLVLLSGIAVLALFASFCIFLTIRAWPAITTYGWAFPFTSAWDPVREQYGALPLLFGTLVSSLLAMCFATPVGLAVAICLAELVSSRIGRVIAFLVELLAAVPSVVIGLWGIFVLAPALREHVYPFLKQTLGFLPLFDGPSYGVGLLTAGIILSIMILPTIASISREVFKAVPRERREAALALGATRWEMISLAVVSSSRTGIFAALILALGRALGETMAVTMVIGNRSQIVASLFAPGQTMASVVANEYAEATSDLHLAALAEVGLLLFAVTLIVNLCARLLIWRLNSKTFGAKQ